MLTVYGMSDSGNCYKPRLLLSLLDRPFRHVEVSTRDGSTRTAEFLRRNPAGQCPLLELDDGRLLAESNAILVYLATGTPFLPDDPFERAQTLRWMFFEQNAHEVSVAVRRSLSVYPERAGVATPERMALTLQNGLNALGVLERRLADHAWFGPGRPSVADIALYPYTATAGDGGFSLEGFPSVRRWLADLEALPGFQPVGWAPTEAA
ncbi:glutathione S-transferase family protein [Aureimonas sp. AU40]|uniref:glutathione S-transferase family protein n=1 Tax=Aureimonas sp. AU40 TaxID=1637747 RepID=UPI0007839D35|nr:glutathione S-transferase family protein [Aureimonas sp. AU40]